MLCFVCINSFNNPMSRNYNSHARFDLNHYTMIPLHKILIQI